MLPNPVRFTMKNQEVVNKIHIKSEFFFKNSKVVLYILTSASDILTSTFDRILIV